MIETTIRNYLVEKNIETFMEFPKNPPQKFVVLQLADAGRKDCIDSCTFFATVYADSLYNAAEYKEEVKSHMLDASSLPAISRAELGGDRAGTDSANNLYKYDLTINYTYYREET